MHTITIGKYSFHHNGDFSGDIIVTSQEDLKYEHVGKDLNGYEEVQIPFEVLAEFVGEAVRNARESRLEQLEWYEVLGLRGKERA